MISKVTKTAVKIKRLGKKKKKNPFVFKPKSKKPKQQLLAKRHSREKRFQLYGLFAIGISTIFLATLLFSIVSNGYTAFFQSKIKLSIAFSESIIDPEGSRNPDTLQDANYRKLITTALKSIFPDIKSRRESKELYGLISEDSSFILRDKVLEDPNILGTSQDVWLFTSSDVDMFVKNKISRDTEPNKRKISDNQITWIDHFDALGAIKLSFNTNFFTKADSREPEQAGVLGSIVGSFFTIIVCMLAAMPIGVATAIYLEEFAPKNWLTDMVEINVNNLAAVPSIIFGLLALAIYLHFFGLPRSSSLVGGLALSMLVLPTIVISTRNAMKAVPPSIRDAARALGASRVQVVMHHTVPYALPGIMTGAILSIARALGETAPLLMIGMVAFVADVPGNFTDPATTLPVQVYLWADSPEMGFAEKTSACIIILLLFLVLANALAVYLRKKYEYEW